MKTLIECFDIDGDTSYISIDHIVAIHKLTGLPAGFGSSVTMVNGDRYFFKLSATAVVQKINLARAAH